MAAEHARLTAERRGTINEYPIGIDLTAAPGLLTTLFNRLSRVVPESQTLIVLDPDVRAQDAIATMTAECISQVPVVRQNRVLGIFSYRSFAQRLCELGTDINDPTSMPIMEFIEQPYFSSMETDVAEIIPALDQQGAVLIGGRTELQAIVTPIDVLKFFYGLAAPYVLIAEIEVAIRALMKRATTPLLLAECVNRVNGRPERRRKVAADLAAMMFNDYILIVADGENWPIFRAAFGGQQEYTRDRLHELRRLRNDIFHFRRPLSDADYQRLRTEREWLRSRADLLDVTAEAGC